jgi:peptidyl-prolyl cis-trans isomerase SurA
MMKLGTFHRAALMLAGSMAAAAAFAQSAGDPPARDRTGLNLPQNPRFLGTNDPNVRKATAIVNGAVITGTDVDHRLALILLGSNARISPEEMQRLREQVLRNLIDETLQIQAAETQEIKIEQRDIDRYYARYAQELKQSPQQFAAYLRANGSSQESLKRQIRGQLAWSGLQHREIEPFVNVSDEEVQSVIARLNAARGQREYKVSEIFLSATPETAAEARANAEKIVEQIKNGASFTAYARQFSEASTAAVGGDLDWVRAEQLPEPIAAAVQQMPVGSLSQPIAIPGGYSIVALQDTRQVLTADPRDAILSLKQLTVIFPPNMPRAQQESRVQDLVRAAQGMGGCGGAEAAAQTLGAEVVSNDQVPVRELPGPLQEALLALSPGQTAGPYGALNERISMFVLCGRDDPPAVGEASSEEVYARLTEERVNNRARRYLRDLRRDAVVDYR